MNETRFGKYSLLGVVGSGGLATVYKATDEELKREVALKVLNSTWPTDSVVAQRFRRELEIAQRLHHPHIISIYEYGEVNERLYLAMEYMAKGSLSRHFSKPTAIRLGATAKIIQSVASALDYAHSQQVIHRDLKLENILIDANNRLVLSDFGIAYVPSSSRLTITGDVFGTPLYIPPEQIVGTKAVDLRADCYSLAVIAYLLAVGYFPFSSESSLETLNRHLVSAPPVPSHLNPRLPDLLNIVLLRGLAKDPTERYASAGEFATAFSQAITTISSDETVVLAWQPTPLSTVPQDYVGLESFLNSPYKTDVIAGMAQSLPPMSSSQPMPRPWYTHPAPGVVIALLIVLLVLGFGSNAWNSVSPDDVAQVATATLSMSATKLPPLIRTANNSNYLPAVTETALMLVPSATATEVLTSALSPEQAAAYRIQFNTFLSSIAGMMPEVALVPTNTTAPSHTPASTNTDTPVPTDTLTAFPTYTDTPVPTNTPTPIRPTRIPATAVPPTAVPVTPGPTAQPHQNHTSSNTQSQPSSSGSGSGSNSDSGSGSGLLDPILPPLVTTLVKHLL